MKYETKYHIMMHHISGTLLDFIYVSYLFFVNKCMLKIIVLSINDKIKVAYFQ